MNREQATVMTISIQVYGTDWCSLTFGVREYLTNSGVDYDYVDIESDPSADAFVRTMNDGRQRYPVVVLAEQAVTNPTRTELERMLRDHGVESRSGQHANTRQSDDL
jgi:glutaredoxin